MNAQEKAQALIDRLISVFKGLDTALAKRALSANFASVLLHVMAKEECTDVQLVAVIQHIFAGRKAIQSTAQQPVRRQRMQRSVWKDTRLLFPCWER